MTLPQRSSFTYGLYEEGGRLHYFEEHMQTVPLTVEAMARICHEANRAYCAALGDESQPRWEDAPEWQKQSAINGASAIAFGHVRSPEDSHKSWMLQKQREGWVYGETKNPDLKQHPCMVPYHQLPAEQRMKDHLFHAIVTQLRGMV